jgi:hypothetical protein
MSRPSSVLQKAQAMTAEAGRIRQGTEAEHDAARVSQRVDEILELLQQLGRSVRAARRLHNASGTEFVDLSGIDDGRTAFARRANTGLPSNQVFTAAKQKIKSVTSRLTAELGAAWLQWTADSITQLPLTRIGLLPQQEQQAASSHHEELTRLARIREPTSTDVSMFLAARDLLADALSQTPDLPQEILPLLERLGRRPPPTLAEVTDEQITLLRQSGMADQIEVRRRGA